ncbi:unnamed protein product [Calypogeia fissa]
MPKDPSGRILSPKSRGSLCRGPYPTSGRGVSQGSSSKEGGGEESSTRKDWEESTCPICMECPHNAVLLQCSSHDKGCRPYMCDTSYRHSNCLDQYRKAKTANDKSNSAEGSPLESVTGGGFSPETTTEMLRSFSPQTTLTGLRGSRLVPPAPGADGAAPNNRLAALHDRLVSADRSSSSTTASAVSSGALVRGLAMLHGTDSRTSDGAGAEFLGEDPTISLGGAASLGLDDDARAPSGAASGGDSSTEVADLLCPLCRGKVFGWKVIEPARHYLNRNPRGCAQEGCSFTGTYKELREHARAVHPLARPSDIDPARQRDWRRLERQRDLGDVLSTIRSAMPGATVLGDYVIDDDEEEHEDEGDESDFPGDDGNWWTVFLLFQMFGPAAPFGGGRGLQGRANRLTRGPAGSPLMRGALWGENFQGSGIGGGISNLNGSNVNVEGGLGGSTSRRRRSRPRSRGDIL